MNQCFKTIRGTKFDKAIKKHFEQRPLWSNVIKKVGTMFGENITEIALLPEELWINLNQLKNEDNKKLFTKDGKLKSNTKKGKELIEQYKQIVSGEGLSDFQEYRLITFTYGIMRLAGQNLESFVTNENDIYYKADFDLAKRAKEYVEPITEIEYEEKYLEELKKKQEIA